MKRLLFTICLMFVVTFCVAETLPSVAGVMFGSRYSTCKTILDKRFNGGKDSYQTSPNKLTYYDVSFAGEEFDYVNFEFQAEGNATYLYYISFFRSFDLNSAEYAKRQRDRLYTVFSEKYDFRWSGTDEDGFKYYIFGHSPNKREDGFINIKTLKGKTNGGEMKYWTNLSYGPVNFVNPSDEI